jgi:nitroreductase
MDWLELMRARHSVRRFLDKPLEGAAVEAIQAEIDACNRESGLHIQLILNEPEAFRAEKAHYGSFEGCKNYLALVGPKDRDEAVGYYGQRIVLAAQAAGVNSCWVALTYKKGKAKIEIPAGETNYMVIALGYGKTQGSPRKSKTPEQISDVTDASPDWYRRGLEAVLLAPTAINQQRFRFSLEGDKVRARRLFGPCTKVDLGIAKLHFELGSGRGPDLWAK